MTEDIAEESGQERAHTCPQCGTELQQATIDMDEEKMPRPEYRPGEHVAVSFCPNRDCPSHSAPA